LSYSDKLQNSNKHKVSLKNTKIKDIRIKDRELKKYLSNHDIRLAHPGLEIIKIILVIIFLILLIILVIFLLILRTDRALKRRHLRSINAINESSLDKNNPIIRKPVQPYSALVKRIPLFTGESMRPPLSNDKLPDDFFTDLVLTSNNLEKNLKGNNGSIGASLSQEGIDQSSEGSFNSSKSKTNTLNSGQNDLADMNKLTSSEKSNNYISSPLDARLRIVIQLSEGG